ncbi:c6 finger domain-containing protein [Stemphylium lycopersici]|nr:c6 finger domain-containing protein [Stemphylium lycopersici]
MVYRGRPSTGCKTCRERKIKCDERPGGCVKCTERRLHCPGYDRNIDAFFHDETAHILAKAKKSKAKAIAAHDTQDAREPRDLREAYLQVIAQQSPAPVITASLIDQGLSFFMSYYCTGIDQPPLQSEEYQKHLSTHGFHPLVATSMTALGIAGVANLYMDSRLKREATRWYLNAIKMANTAISSPKDVTADSTLTSVHLLGMFEATFNDSSLAGWSNHVDGAASLVKMRGMEQFSTPAGQRMYLHTVGNVCMNCMGRGVPIPQYVHDLNSEVIKHLDANDPRNRFFFLHIKTIDLRARILNQETYSLTDIIQSALELDDIAVNIFKDQGPDWDYDVVLCEKREDVFEHFYHVYPTAVTAQTWNWVRYNRIYFHDIIRNSILAGFASTPPALVGTKYHEQLEQSTQTLHKLQSDIIASMPQFLHDVPNVAPSKTSNHAGEGTASVPSTPSSTSNSSSSSPDFQAALKSFDKNFRGNSVGVVRALIGTGSVKDRVPIVRVAGGYSTVWALYVAAAMPIATPESQEFIAKCMSRVEREFGINQAKVLADALQYKRLLTSKGAIAFGICPQYLPPDGGSSEQNEETQLLATRIVEMSDEEPQSPMYETLDEIA